MIASIIAAAALTGTVHLPKGVTVVSAPFLSGLTIDFNKPADMAITTDEALCRMLSAAAAIYVISPGHFSPWSGKVTVKVDNKTLKCMVGADPKWEDAK